MEPVIVHQYARQVDSHRDFCIYKRQSKSVAGLKIDEQFFIRLTQEFPQLLGQAESAGRPKYCNLANASLNSAECAHVRPTDLVKWLEFSVFVDEAYDQDVRWPGATHERLVDILYLGDKFVKPVADLLN